MDALLHQTAPSTSFHISNLQDSSVNSTWWDGNISSSQGPQMDPRFSRSTQCPLLHNSAELRTLGIAESTLSAALFLINLVFVYVLFRRRRTINWKMTVFTLNLAISDLFSSLALLAMSISVVIASRSGSPRWCVKGRSPVPEWVEISVQAIITTSVLLTVLNYNIFVLAQYTAVKWPIFHRTHCGSSRFRCVVIWTQWCVVLAYVVMKSAVIIRDVEHPPSGFSAFELTFMGLSIVWSVGAYAYVLHVARRWQRQRLIRRGLIVERLNTTSVDSNSAPTRRMESEESTTSSIADAAVVARRRRRLITNPSAVSMSDIWGSVFQRYQSVVNAGIHLGIYVVAFFPMWLVRVLTATDVGIHNSGAMYDVYSCSTAWCSITVCTWFCRGILDPFVHVWRHPELLRSSSSSTNRNVIVSPREVQQQSSSNIHIIATSRTTLSSSSSSSSTTRDNLSAKDYRR